MENNFLKKGLVIGLILLLFGFSIGPSFNGNPIKIEDNISNQNINNSLYMNKKEIQIFDCDLGIIFNKCYLDGTMVKDGSGRFFDIFYILDVKIKNYGEPYSGEVNIVLYTSNGLDGNWKKHDYWSTFNLNLDSNNEKNFELHTPSIDPADDIDVLKEKDFAGNLCYVELELIDGNDINMDNNKVYGAIKHWMDFFHQTTHPQVDGSSPYAFREISVNKDLSYFESYYDYYELGSFPDRLKNNRMGWVYKLAEHLYIITKDIRKIILEHIEFALAVTTIIATMITCTGSILTFCETIMIGNPITEALAVFIAWWLCVEPALDSLENVAQGWSLEIQQKVEKLKNDCQDFKDWCDEEPWQKPILIEGVIKNVLPTEVVTISCRDFVDTYVDDNDDGKISFSFEVTSDPVYDSHNFWFLSHLCILSYSGSLHEELYHTGKLYSKSFSDGKIVFGNEYFKSRSKIKILNYNFSNFFNSYPILKLILLQLR